MPSNAEKRAMAEEAAFRRKERRALAERYEGLLHSGLSKTDACRRLGVSLFVAEKALDDLMNGKL